MSESPGKLYEVPRFKAAGDRGLLIELGEGIDLEVNGAVQALARALGAAGIEGVEERVPSYRTLLVHYDPERIDTRALELLINGIAGEARLGAGTAQSGKTVEVPVCYGGEYGPDLEYIADNAGLSSEEVVALHSGRDYPIYTIGFTPGFPFLGGLDERLRVPRLESPRLKVLRGSVGIAEAQTGIYPLESPGGWRLLGRTPLKLFSPENEAPFLYAVGDRLRFVPITPDEYALLEREQG